MRIGSIPKDDGSTILLFLCSVFGRFFVGPLPSDSSWRWQQQPQPRQTQQHLLVALGGGLRLQPALAGSAAPAQHASLLAGAAVVRAVRGRQHAALPGLLQRRQQLAADVEAELAVAARWRAGADAAPIKAGCSVACGRYAPLPMPSTPAPKPAPS